MWWLSIGGVSDDLDAKSFEESVKKAVAQIEESPFMKRTEMASAEQYFQVCAIGYTLLL